MAHRPGEQEGEGGPVRTAISTSTLGNATAFGFSITITGAFAMLQAQLGSPHVGEILLFGIAAAATIGIVQAVVTRGFRVRPGAAPAEVRMLATAQDFISVAAALGAAAGVGAVLHSAVAWAVGGALPTFVFLATASAEALVAELVQKRRGDPEAEESQPQ